MMGGMSNPMMGQLGPRPMPGLMPSGRTDQLSLQRLQQQGPGGMGGPGIGGPGMRFGDMPDPAFMEVRQGARASS
jgi:hypothetical protein